MSTDLEQRGRGTGRARPARATGASFRWMALGALILASAGCATLQGLWGGGRKGPPPPAWVEYPEAQVAKVEDPHNYLGSTLCQRCHTGPSGALKGSPITVCTGCHQQKHGNHPVDIVHKTPSKDLPYGEGGRIVCHTCHDPHQLRFQKKGLRLAFNDLCLKCHAQH